MGEGVELPWRAETDRSTACLNRFNSYSEIAIRGIGISVEGTNPRTWRKWRLELIRAVGLAANLSRLFNGRNPDECAAALILRDRH